MKELILAILLLPNLICAQNIPNKRFNKVEERLRIDTLRNDFGSNKQILEDLELAALIALSYFPELSTTNIQFERSDTKTTMETRPEVGSLFSGSLNRRYIIHVDDKIISNNGLLVESIPFNALIGLIGHEYAHIIEYEKMSIYELGRLASMYSNPSFKKEFEQDTDRATIDRGLGWQLFDWADFALDKCSASQKYKNYKKLNYLSKEQILEIMKSQKIYTHFFN